MIELLSPAKNLECGIEAIKHGADAVYIGAGRFGARQAAGNSVDDIAQLTHFAHFYGAKVYVTVNTIIKDCELADAEKLIWQLYEAGADALLVQDMAVLRRCMPAPSVMYAVPIRYVFWPTAALPVWCWPVSCHLMRSAPSMRPVPMWSWSALCTVHCA